MFRTWLEVKRSSKQIGRDRGLSSHFMKVDGMAAIDGGFRELNLFAEGREVDRRAAGPQSVQGTPR